MTPDRAGVLLSKSTALAGVERMTFSLPRGCFTIANDATIKPGDLERDRRLSESRALRDDLQRARDLDLLDFEFSPVAASVSAPPEGCEELWASYHGAKGDQAGAVKLVAWRTMMSDKALVAGLSPGQSFVTRRQTLVAITGITPQDPDTTIVEYTWRWAPPYESAHLGIRESAEKSGRATFKRTSNGWRTLE